MKLSLILMIITIISKFFGLGREMLLSYYYGTGAIADAFLIAFFIPSLMLNGITLGIGTGFIPVYNEINAKSGEDRALKFTNNLVTIICFASIIISTIGIIYAEPLVKLFASGFEGLVLQEAVLYTRMILTSVTISAIAGVFRGYLQIKHIFAVTVAHSIIMNVVIMISIALSYYYGDEILGIGSAIGIMLQYAIFIPALKSTKYKYSFNFDLKDKYIGKMIKLTIPILIGVIVNEVNLMIDRNIASSISVGAVSALNYSSDLQDFVSGVVIVSIVTAVFPAMSEHATAGNKQGLVNTLFSGLSSMFFLVIPATVGMAMFSEEIVRLLFGRGSFDEISVMMTSSTLYYYAMGFVGIGVRELISRVFYSINNTRTPVISSVIMVCLNIILNIILSRIMGITGLALATSIANTFGALLMLFAFKRHFAEKFSPKLLSTIFKSIIATALMAVSTKFVFTMLLNSMKTSYALLISIVFAVIIYVILTIAFKVEDALKFKTFVYEKTKRTN